jgi:hypothetical protein
MQLLKEKCESTRASKEGTATLLTLASWLNRPDVVQGVPPPLNPGRGGIAVELCRMSLHIAWFIVYVPSKCNQDSYYAWGPNYMYFTW